jgi:hypothetical protein
MIPGDTMDTIVMTVQWQSRAENRGLPPDLDLAVEAAIPAAVALAREQLLTVDMEVVLERAPLEPPAEGEEESLSGHRLLLDGEPVLLVNALLDGHCRHLREGNFEMLARAAAEGLDLTEAIGKALKAWIIVQSVVRIGEALGVTPEDFSENLPEEDPGNN